MSDAAYAKPRIIAAQSILDSIKTREAQTLCVWCSTSAQCWKTLST